MTRGTTTSPRRAIDWRGLAAYLLEQQAEPTVVLDSEGAVVGLNAAMEGLLRSERGILIARDWCSACTCEEEIPAVRALLQEAARGIIKTFELPARSLDNDLMTLGVAAEPVGAGSGSVLILRVKSVEMSAEPGLRDYRISRRAHDLGLVQMGQPPGAEGHRCYRVFHGRATPCPGCPALDLPAGPTRIGIVSDGRTGRLTLVEVRGMDAASIRVVCRELPADFVPHVLASRVAHLSRSAGLSARESRILLPLLEGRTHEEIAEDLGIAVRTVKFHQTNLLAKLGVSTRIELLGAVFRATGAQGDR